MDKRGRIDAEDDGTYTFVCLADRLRGDSAVAEGHPLACGYSFTRAATKKQANARGAEHLAEHDTGEPAPELADSAARA